MKCVLFLSILVAACDNTPHPVNPDNGVFIRCAGGGYCLRASEVCGQRGHACDENRCCFVGDDGVIFGSKWRTKSGVGDGGTP